MARIQKTSCDVCGAEHDTEDRASEHRLGAWIEVGFRLDYNYLRDGSEKTLDVCNRDSCISSGFARLYEEIGARVMEHCGQMRARLGGAS